MKPIYILERYNDSAVRRQRATLDEIRAVVDGESSDRLAYVRFSDDGDIIATPLAEQDLAAIRDELSVEHERRIRHLLDSAVIVARAGRGLGGITVGMFGTWVVTIWIGDGDGHESTADVAFAWATEHGAEVNRNSPPTTPRRWRPDAEIKLDGLDICRILWPEREAFDDAAVEQEIDGVRKAREVAATELAEVAF